MFALAPGAVAQPPEPAAVSVAQPDAAEDAEGLRVAVVVVRASAMSDRVEASPQELRGALELRAPGRRVVVYGQPDPSPHGERWALLDVWIEDDTVSLSLILDDGRAFDRRLDAEPRDAARAVAATASNLLAAIEEERIEPDREDVEVPPITPEPTPEPKPPEPEPKPPEPEPKPEPKPPEPKPAPKPYSLGVHLTPALMFGLGPPTNVDTITGGGAALGVDLRFPRGAIVGLDVRGATRFQDNFRLDRLRFAVSGGYDFRLNAFELDTRLAATVEPWHVEGEGDPELGSDEDEVEDPGPAIGLALQIAPGLWYRTRRVAVRFSLWTELAVSGVIASGGLTTARISRAGGMDDDPEALFRMGGLELAAGLRVGLWFDLAGRRRAR